MHENKRSSKYILSIEEEVMITNLRIADSGIKNEIFKLFAKKDDCNAEEKISVFDIITFLVI